MYADAELVAEVADFVAMIAPHGDRNALAQLAIKLCAPGVPDIYQGSELANDSLVDPDNRRPVDLDARRRALRILSDASAREVATAELGLRKLWMIRRVLATRAHRSELFAGAYRALAADGPHAHRVFAFTRGDGLALVTPRLGVGAEGWARTTIALAGHVARRADRSHDRGRHARRRRAVSGIPRRDPHRATVTLAVRGRSLRAPALGTGRELIASMSPTHSPTAQLKDQRPRARALSWLASLSVAAGELGAAEGYLLELLAWCAFADRPPTARDD